MTRAARSPWHLAALLLVAGCVTIVEEAPLGIGSEEAAEALAQSVRQTIPFGVAETDPKRQLLVRFYAGVLDRLQEAAEERDADLLASLLDRYERPGLPGWLAERLGGYRAVVGGIRFCRRAEADAVLVLVDQYGKDVEEAGVPPIGEPVRVEFRLPVGPVPLDLGGEDPLAFRLTITILDDYVDGGSRRVSEEQLQRLPGALHLEGDSVLRMPFEFRIPPGEAVHRRLRLSVSIMPGYVRTETLRCPVPMCTLAEIEVSQWPAGYEPIAARPLATLREALRLGDERHFPHVYLAAVFSRGADREAVIDLLVDQVRFGNASQAKIAMAALRAATGADIAVGERERWLAWYDLRR